jgi:hypothetical protein
MRRTMPKPRRAPEKPDSLPGEQQGHPLDPPAPLYSGSEDDTPTRPLPVITPAVEDAMRDQHGARLRTARSRCSRPSPASWS